MMIAPLRVPKDEVGRSGRKTPVLACWECSPFGFFWALLWPDARCLVITVLLLPEMRSRGEATVWTEGIVFQTGDQNPRVDQKIIHHGTGSESWLQPILEK